MGICIYSFVKNTNKMIVIKFTCAYEGKDAKTPLFLQKHWTQEAGIN